jgi:hypothetical protein
VPGAAESVLFELEGVLHNLFDMILSAYPEPLSRRLRLPDRHAVLPQFVVAFLLGAFVAGCHDPGPNPPTQARSLPKIKVGSDSRTFRDARGRSFVPFGVNYYRPGTGWAPQLWKKFDAEATRQDFQRMKSLGVNCVRVFLTYGSFYNSEGVLNPDGLAKFDRFLEIAEEAGIYVHPTGPDHWEGMPDWRPVSIEEDRTVAALESFWRLFAARYRGRNVLFAYDLKNEPEMPWESETMTRKWHAWLQKKYASAETMARAWGATNSIEFVNVPVPSPQDQLRDPRLLDYQSFRESVADEWTHRQVAAIKSADPAALVTVGLIQWSIPCVLPGSVRYYAAFRPERQARFLDFLEVHFYPLARGAFEYADEASEQANLAYLEAVVREVARCGKPVVLAEFGWYGGGKPKFDGGKHPFASQEQHAQYCRRVVETSAGYATGWLNWGFYDQPEATDCSELTGLATASGETKAWGRTFAELAARYGGRKASAPPVAVRPNLDWDACLTSTAAAREFQEAYLRAFLGGQ